MAAPVYEQLAAALDRLPNAFPRTASDVELRILERIFTPDEAALGALLTREMEPVESVAARAGLAVRDTRSLIIHMARRGLVWIERRPGELLVRLAPFVVGFYEAQVDVIDHDLAHLMEEYLAQGGIQGIMGPEPALHRVIPAQSALKTEQILPYDDVRALFLQARWFHQGECIALTLHFAKAGDIAVELNVGGLAQQTPPDAGTDASSEMMDMSHDDMSGMSM